MGRGEAPEGCQIGDAVGRLLAKWRLTNFILKIFGFFLINIVAPHAS